ncbi:hypothetical protein D3C85_1525280 [compost metagenome]
MVIEQERAQQRQGHQAEADGDVGVGLEIPDQKDIDLRGVVDDVADQRDAADQTECQGGALPVAGVRVQNILP